MPAALRPMSLGEILDRSFGIYRKHFLLFVSIAAPMMAVVFGLSFLFHSSWNFYSSLVCYDLCGFLLLLAFPAFVDATSKALFGKQPRIYAAIRFVWAGWHRYLWVAILQIAAGVVFLEVLTIAFAIGAGFGLGELGLAPKGTASKGSLIVLALVTFGALLFLWVQAGLSFSVPAASLERIVGTKALRRSWILTKKRRWQIVLTFISIPLVAWISAATFEFVIGQLLWRFYQGQHYGVTGAQFYSVAAFVTQFVVATVSSAILPTFLTVSYYDQRVRSEGFDLEKMMEEAGWTA